jgi:hypothetical protein
MSDADKNITPATPEYHRGFLDGMKYLHNLYKKQGRLLPEKPRAVGLAQDDED